MSSWCKTMRVRAAVWLLGLSLLAAGGAAPALAGDSQGREEARQTVDQPADQPATTAAERERRLLAELTARIEELEAEIARLREEGRAGEGTTAPEPDRLAELERRLELLAAELERQRLGEAAATAEESRYGFGPAASKIYRTGEGLSIGGYGEALYESFDSARDDGNASGRTDRIDFLRAILYFGYKFNDRLLFNSEIEIEHAKSGDGEPGEVAVEFAYLDYLWRPEANLRAGMLLIPMGLVNELHEPTVFLSARRPGIESAIIPTTWREIGLGVFGDAGPIAYRAYLVNGLDAEGFSAAGLRDGRQNGAQADAEDFALVGRADWTALPGLLVGGSAYAGDSAQAIEGGPPGATLDVGTTILEGHLEWRRRGLTLRALAAQAELDDVAALNSALGLAGAASVGERLAGYYLEAGYDLFTLRPRGERSLTPFVRWERYDTQDEVPAGFAANPANDLEIVTAGLAYQPDDQVVVKLDYQDVDNEAGTGTDQINVAVGYIF